MHESDVARGGRSGTERAEPIRSDRIGVDESHHDRDAPRRELPDEMSDQCCLEVVGARGADGVGDVDDERGPTALITMQSHVGHSTADRRGQIGEVAVALGARAEHGVREHDRVRLAPRDMLPESGSSGEQVGRARPRGPRAHLGVRIHQRLRRAPERDITAEVLWSSEVERGHVERRRHPDACALLSEPFGEVEPGPTVVEAPVDVGPGNRDQAARTCSACEPGEDAHRSRHTRTLLAREHGPFVIIEPQGEAHRDLSAAQNRTPCASGRSSEPLIVFVARRM